MHESDQCRACGATALHPHLRVAGDAGPQGLIPTTDRYGTALADIVRCDSCGHMQLERFPEAETLEQAYEGAASEDYVEQERGQRETARRLLERIERHAPRGSRAARASHDSRRILDLGCWTGFLLAEAQQRGWRPSGVEPSEWASAFARERLGLDDIQTAGLHDARLEPGAYTAVVMADVIEHLVDPLAALARIRGALTGGGVLCLVLPDAGSAVARALGRRWWSVLPTHVQYFTRSSIAMLLARAGFEPLELATAPKAFAAAYYIDRLKGYSPPLARALNAAAARAGLADRLVAPDFRDRMLVLARPRPAAFEGAQPSSSATARSASSTP